MAKFKIGELAVINNKISIPVPSLSEWAKKQIGTIVEILSLERPRNFGPAHTDDIWYKVQGVNEAFWAAERILEKLQPPPPRIEETGSWNEILKSTGYSRRELEV